ncbi:WD-REPEATS-REGION domain-containing protein [Mycena indigotica]|uniref:WD-REPEATS-REGION domain-containing protein n=1 Tax=Mycena indigotica TaxID=2126181 RepID=A0A8H6W6K5_9AGAR|nr:WD-REPEATS-REGION domain-containing protein [Mycena indigotica]KAF7303513.1 WD-REPEATS-REGION domain-containing protein [Mycena indigotica]
MSKRPASPPPGGALVKRARATPPPPGTQIAISSAGDKNKGLIRSVQRTSGLEAPIISLAGAHRGEILSCRFDPTGQNIAACSTDRGVSLWRTYPPNNNYGLLSSLAKAPILDLQWSLCAPHLYTVAADHTLITTDVTTGKRVRKIRAHREIVNSVDRTMAGGSGTELVATGGDDGVVRVWDGGEDGGKDPVTEFEVGCPVTAVCWSADGASVYAAALDNEIHIYDLRKSAQISTLTGHTDTPTSLALSPNGSFLLSPSFSSQTIIHDVRPFAANPTRIHRVLTGSPAGFEHTLLRAAWSKNDDGARVAVGGADRMVLPGHKGTVTAVDFHPKEPIILTGSKDGTMLLGELDPSAGLGVSVSHSLYGFDSVKNERAAPALDEEHDSLDI